MQQQAQQRLHVLPALLQQQLGQPAGKQQQQQVQQTLKMRPRSC
jgi:hypothetical protein